MTHCTNKTKRFYLSTNLFVIFSFILFNVQGQNLFSDKYSENELKQIIIPREKWIPFPKVNDRTAWEKADKDRMEAILANANKHIDYEWPGIPATYSLAFMRTGDRDQFEQLSFKKRNILGTMIIAEIYENKGRFIDPIINGIWSICEESWWGAPAHLPEEHNSLMDVTDQFVDLFSAETATVISWADYFLGDKFDEVSPTIRKRIRYEVHKRILDPLMTKHHWWMDSTFYHRRPNNWNPRVCSNWLNITLLLEENEENRVKTIARILEILDEYVNPYPQDGGCDEGPTYWGAATAVLFDNISLLNLCSAGSFNYIYEDTKIKNMATYIYKVQISEKYFINFADASPQIGINSNTIYRIGKAINDEKMMEFGAFYQKQEASGNASMFQYFRNFYDLFIKEELSKIDKTIPLPANVWFPDLEVMVARDKEGSTDGFFTAAKGGHNDESHNHNDVGNFIVYYDGLPLLIDVGRGTYTRRTFNNERYDIWSNCSDYHNIPTINGYTQPAGSEYKAYDVNYEETPEHTQLSLDLSKAYPNEAKVKSWKRTVRLERGNKVDILEHYELKSANAITCHMMTCYPVKTTKSGEIVINYKDKDETAVDFKMLYDAEKCNVTIEKVKLESMEDQGIKKHWGDNIYRINFNVKKPKKQDELLFTILNPDN